MRRRIGATALCALALSACGSRADFTALTTTDGSGQPLTGTTTGGVSPSSGDVVGVPGTTGGVSPGTGTSGAGTITTGTGGTGGGATGSSGTTTGLAGTASKAPIRLAYIIQGSAGVSALTGAEVGEADADVAVRNMDALVAYINENGGVGGRKVSARGFRSEATSPQPERLALCKQITEDYKAEVVLDHNQYLTEESWSCFAQHKAVYVGTVTATDRRFLSRLAPYVMTTWLALDRSMKAIVDGAQRTGFLTGGKVGVVLADEPTMHRLYDTVLEPALARAGVKDPEVRYISNDSSGGGQQAQTNSAVLAFASAGVNRIVWFHNILPYLIFTNQAESQGYRPRYAFSDYQGMTGVAAFYGNANQNAGAIAVSSTLTSIFDDDSRRPTDTSAAYDRKKMSRGQQRCLDLLSKRTGRDYYDPQESGDTLATWAQYCDELFAWWEGARLVGAAWTPSLQGRGQAQVGSRHLSTIQWSTRFGSGVFDGASTYRVGRYTTSCGCFVKTTGWLPI